MFFRDAAFQLITIYARKSTALSLAQKVSFTSTTGGATAERKWNHLSPSRRYRVQFHYHNFLLNSFLLRGFDRIIPYFDFEATRRDVWKMNVYSMRDIATSKFESTSRLSYFTKPVKKFRSSRVGILLCYVNFFNTFRNRLPFNRVPSTCVNSDTIYITNIRMYR